MVYPPAVHFPIVEPAQEMDAVDLFVGRCGDPDCDYTIIRGSYGEAWKSATQHARAKNP